MSDHFGTLCTKALINGPLEKVNLVRFESVNEELIRRAAVNAKTGSGVDADEW